MARSPCTLGLGFGLGLGFPNPNPNPNPNLLQLRVPPVEDFHQRGLGVEHLHRRGAADDQQLVMLRREVHLVRVRATG